MSGEKSDDKMLIFTVVLQRNGVMQFRFDASNEIVEPAIENTLALGLLARAMEHFTRCEYPIKEPS